jgi:hypothetical protein
MPAQANNLFDGHDTCTTINCGTLAIEGRILTYRDANGTPTAALPWSGMVYAAEGECLRLDIVARFGTTGPLLIQVQGPSFHRYNTYHVSPSCSSCPLVKVDPAPHSGWYSIVVRPVGGSWNDASFRLHIGRYNSGNPNCASPSPEG